MALPSYFADIHTKVVVKSVMILAPVRAEVPLLDAPDWDLFERPDAIAHGSLGVAMMRGSLAERVMSARGDVVLELDMDVDGESRTIVATLGRSVRTYLWST